MGGVYIRVTREEVDLEGNQVRCERYSHLAMAFMLLPFVGASALVEGLAMAGAAVAATAAAAAVVEGGVAVAGEVMKHRRAKNSKPTVTPARQQPPDPPEKDKDQKKKKKSEQEKQEQSNSPSPPRLPRRPRRIRLGDTTSTDSDTDDPEKASHIYYVNIYIYIFLIIQKLLVCVLTLHLFNCTFAEEEEADEEIIKRITDQVQDGAMKKSYILKIRTMLI